MELEQCLNFVLTRAQQTIHQLFKAELAPYGVTPGQYAVLRCLWDEDGQTAKQLAERLGLDGSTVTGILDRMEQKGLLEKRTDTRDRRALSVVLTDAGAKLQEPLSGAIERANARALEGMEVSRRKALHQMLTELGSSK